MNFNIFKRNSPETEKVVPRKNYGANPHTRGRIASRSFEAVTANMISGWDTTTAPINAYLRDKLVPMVARSREQARNNEYAKRFVTLVKSNVIGPEGVAFQAQAVDSRGNLDEVANTAVEKAHKDWALSHCSVDPRMTWLDNQNVLMASVVTDGEGFVEIFRGPQYGKYGFKIRVLDPQLIDPTLTTMTRSGNPVRMGIEYDQFDVPVAYYVRKLDLMGHYMSVDWRRVPVENMLHVYKREWPGQERGIPWMTAAIYRMKMLHGYDEAAVTAARAGASKMGFYVRDAEADEDYAEGMATNDEGTPVDESTPGHFETLPVGWDFKANDPSYPHEQYQHFVKSCLRGVSAGLDVSYNTLANDLEGVNYSSIRAGVLEDREIWKALQTMVIHAVHGPMDHEWFKMAYLSGQVRVGTTPLNRGIEYYSKYKHQGRRWSWVDPAKDQISAKGSVDMRTNSTSALIREQGKDPMEVYKELASDERIFEELGLKTAPEPTLDSGIRALIADEIKRMEKNDA